jgi:hypothetical protein
MSTDAALLLRQIETIGGKLTVLPGGQLLCDQIPRSFESRLASYKDELIRLLQLPQPEKPLTREELRKLIRTIEKEGGEFRRTEHFMEIELPDSLAHLKDTLRENGDGVYHLLFPPKPRSSRPKRGCQVCKTGRGCRTRAAIKVYEICPVCKHWCRSHYPRIVGYDGTEWIAAGCLKWIEADPESATPRMRCQCPGWPVAPLPARRALKAAGPRASKNITVTVGTATTTSAGGRS